MKNSFHFIGCTMTTLNVSRCEGITWLHKLPLASGTSHHTIMLSSRLVQKNAKALARTDWLITLKASQKHHYTIFTLSNWLWILSAPSVLVLETHSVCILQFLKSLFERLMKNLLPNAKTKSRLPTSKTVRSPHRCSHSLAICTLHDHRGNVSVMLQSLHVMS